MTVFEDEWTPPPGSCPRCFTLDEYFIDTCVGENCPMKKDNPVVEKAVESPVVVRAERAGWFCRKVSWPNRIGAPDRVFIKGGRVVWIEFKDDGKEARLSQQLEHDRMRAAGAEVYVCDNVSDALRILGL